MGLSVPEFALGNPVDIGKPAIRITREVDALNQCQQAVIGAVGDLDRERGLVKSLDIVADKAAQQAAQAALGGIIPSERLDLLLKVPEGPQTVVLLGKRRVQVVHVSLFGE